VSDRTHEPPPLERLSERKRERRISPGWKAAIAIAIGLVAGIYSLVEAKTGGLIFDNWLLLPPRSYLEGIVSLAALLVGTWPGSNPGGPISRNDPEG
jgi:hypothetical protein